jgi:hypothetical protein
MKEFWTETVTAKSWVELLSFSKKYNFILIGGWAAYLWTEAHKSKDIDIIIDYDTLNILRKDFTLEKNDRLKKYEIKRGEFDIGIYLPSYSKLAVPIETIEENTTKIQGIKVPNPEILVLLKQSAEIERRHSIRGKKDLIDIINILIHSGFSIKKYKEITSKLSIEKYVKELENEVNLFNSKDVDYIGVNLNEFAKWKRKFISEIKN